MTSPKSIVMYMGTSGQNPGRCAFGVVLVNAEQQARKELSGGYTHSILNRAGILGFAMGFESLSRPWSVTVYCPMNYLIDVINRGQLQTWAAKGWQGTHADLWKRLYEAMESHRVTFIYASLQNLPADFPAQGSDELIRVQSLAKEAYTTGSLVDDLKYTQINE